MSIPSLLEMSAVYRSCGRWTLSFSRASLGRRMLARWAEQKKVVALPGQLRVSDENGPFCCFKLDELVKGRKIIFLTNLNVLQENRTFKQTGTIPSMLLLTLYLVLSFSGLKVNRLDMYGEKYKPFKGVKYITKAGKFQVRTWEDALLPRGNSP